MSKIAKLPEYRDIASFKSASVSTTVDIVKRGRGIGGKPNIPAAERKMIRTLLGYSVVYYISDKILGPVLYSRDVYLDQCKVHLEDGKGPGNVWAHKRVAVVDRLKCLLTAYSEPVSAVEQVSKKFLKWAPASLERDMLCKYFVIWKLHKKVNALGVRSRPIVSNIGYPTGQVSHFLNWHRDSWEMLCSVMSLSWRTQLEGCLVQVGNGIELEAVGLQFEPYWWRLCGVIWDSSRTVVVIKLLRTSALASFISWSARISLKRKMWFSHQQTLQRCTPPLISSIGLQQCNGSWRDMPAYLLVCKGYISG